MSRTPDEEEQLRSTALQNATLRATLDSTTDAILVTGPSHEFVDQNDKLLQMWQTSRADLRGLSGAGLWHALMHHSGGAAQQLARLADIESSTEESFDELALDDGRQIERYSTVQVVDGVIVGRVWSFRDVTERRKLEVMQHRLAAVVESSDDAIVSKDLTGIVQTWNPGAERIFGYSAAEMIGAPILRLIPPELRDEERLILDRQRRGERIEHYETVRLTKDGRRIDVSLTVSPIRDANGKIVGASKVARDITTRKRAEADLRRSEEELRALADSIPQLAWMAHADGHIFWYNRVWFDYTGTRLEDMEGWGWQAVHHPDVLPEVLVRWRESVAAGTPFEMEFPIRGADGTFRWFLTRVRPIQDAGGRVIRWFGTNTDVDDVKRAAEDRQKLLDAERTARSEAERISFMKDEFLATLSHELRTPLNAIVGWAQVLRNRKNVDQEVLDGLAVIDRNARVQAQLIEDLLDMSRIVSGKVRLDVQRVDVGDVARAALASVRHSAEAKDIHLQVVLDPQAGPVWGDPGRLQQCFWNLVSNAIKFTPKGGKVQVTLACVNSHLELTVADNGQGIDAAFLPHVFERFRQADSSSTRYHGGLGLGLSIVKSLVELHGGTVSANSAGKGKGAVFTIELPVMATSTVGTLGHREHPRSTAGMLPFGDPPSLEGITVLVVDDEPDALSLVTRVLEDCGATVLSAASAHAALEILDRQRPDVLISDIGMPEEDGYMLIQQVRAREAQHGRMIPAAALSAFARPEDRTRALRAGYQLHLSKPVDPIELTAVVASLAARRV